ncbi:hypothetical protein J5N97_024419 [Dioscorea zingiberensis]|uniref:Uncharacterized protein n=1 Tax=Dioscorea zingiberensis TaxID=325984 RepID=A0A9D5H8W5_9LILI|nr:hypothetical protein J5N97_024419 [Dioscorea zingiberensis]
MLKKTFDARDLMGMRHWREQKKSSHGHVAKSTSKTLNISDGQEDISKNVNDVLSNNQKDKFIANIPTSSTYLEPAKDDSMESNEEYEDQLVREIELEMDNMWNAQLDWEEDKQEEEEIGVDLIIDNQIESTPKNNSNMEEKGHEMKTVKGPEDTNKGSNDPQQAEPKPIESLGSIGPVDNQRPNTSNSIGKMPSNKGPEPELDLSKYKWRHINGLLFGVNPRSVLPDFPTIHFSKAMDDAMSAIFLQHTVPSRWWKLMRWLDVGEEKRLTRARKVID